MEYLQGRTKQPPFHEKLFFRPIGEKQSPAPIDSIAITSLFMKIAEVAALAHCQARALLVGLFSRGTHNLGIRAKGEMDRKPRVWVYRR